MMRKKIVSLCMALVLCLSLLPATALAATPNGQVLYIGGVQISSTGYWTTDSEGKVTSAGATQPSDNYIHYDVANNTLTLHNATIKESVSTNTSTFIAGAAIGVLNQNGDAELTITLEGTNTIAEVGKGIYVLANSTDDATLTITGDGSLDASARQTGIWVQSNNGDAALFIQNAKVEATGTSYGVNVQSRESSTASLTVDGGSLTASGSPGILYDSIGSGTVPKTTALTISNSAIVDARGGGIGAGLLQDLEDVSPADDSVGIVFDGDDGTVYGSVTLQEDLTIGEGESLTLAENASLSAGGHNVIVDGGTVDEGLEEELGNNVKYPPTITTASLLNGEVGRIYNQTLEATGSDTITWSVTSGSLPAGLSLSGSSISGTPTAVDTSTFTVTAENSYGSNSKELSITISAPASVSVTGVSLNKDSLNLYVGDNETLTATVAPANATNQAVTWTSSNPSVAKVENGVVTALACGTAVITAAAADGSGASASCTVTVSSYLPPANPNYRITVEATQGGTVTADPTAAKAGTTVTLTPVPHRGYQVGSVAVTDRFGDPVAVTEQADGTYTFVMPNGQVTVTVTFAEAPLPFPDVTEGDWFYDAVRYAYETGLMDGVGDSLFAPNSETTRAQLVTILYRLEGEPEVSGTSGFTDVEADTWYTDAVAWAAANGIVNGVSETEFAPGKDITREQLATILFRYAEAKGYDVSARADLSAYTDADQIQSYAAESVAWAVAEGLIQGFEDNTLRPAGNATRAQIATILMRFCEGVAK